METFENQDSIRALVSRVFAIEDSTVGGDKQAYLFRYRGHLILSDSATAYDQLAALLTPYNLTPLFRIEDKQQVIFLVRAKPVPTPGRPVVNLIMFILTLVSVIYSGWMFSNQTFTSTNPVQIVLEVLKGGWPFAVSLMAILGVHEFGHYFAGRAHGVHVTLPFFIPLPYVGFGTMGAFISMKDNPKNRNALMDIGAAGPLAGVVVAVIVMVIGLSLSKVSALPTTVPPGQAFQIEGNSLLYLLLKYLQFGQLLPAPASFGGVSPALYWLKYFFTGRPLPLGGLDVMISPVAWAGWAGFLVTSLNLLPAGQLDGGHIFHLLFGTKVTRALFPVILVALVLLGFAWDGWWLWAFLVFMFGRIYAEPLDQITPLDGKRKLLGIVALIVFILTFIPVPLTFLL